MSSKGGWSSAIFVIFVEIPERFAFYGLAGNLITYLKNNLGEPVATAAKNVNTWVGVSSIFPLLGAFIADSYLGHFKTILASSFIYFLGMVLLSLLVSVIPIHSRKAVFFTAFYVLAIGEGGHKPCVQTFAADQFEENNPEEKVAKSSFFNRKSYIAGRETGDKERAQIHMILHHSYTLITERNRRQRESSNLHRPFRHITDTHIVRLELPFRFDEFPTAPTATEIDCTFS